MRKLFFLLILTATLFPHILQSQNINSKQIAEYAKTALSQRNHSLTKEQLTVKSIDYVIENEDTLMGIINFSPCGFIIMGMNEKTTPVWAYSTENNFILGKNSAAAFTLIDEYKGSVKEDIAHEATSQHVSTAWDQIKNNAKSAKGTPIVSPLITALWNQDKYYNQYSPIDSESPSGYDNKVPNGCVALAMAMIMYYYRYPETGSGTHTNYTNYGNYTVNFAQQTYNYNAMSDQLSTYNSEVAKLIFHCATSVDMRYAADGSGAFSENVADALKTYFKYSSSASYKNKRNHSNTEWREMLISSLDQKKPLYYSGRSDEGGHAFLCDGYDEDTLFHFNFGWGGAGNGYFVVNSSSSSTGGYNGSQAAIFDIYPSGNYPNYCNGTTMITSYSGTLEDGSGNENYAHNSECTYIIAPPNASNFRIKVDHLKTEAENDKLTFWEGHPANNMMVREISGEEKNLSFTVSSDTLYITFVTNGDTTDDGWRISYSVDSKIAPCTGYIVLEEHSGTKDDGSGRGIAYAPNNNCVWLLRPREDLTTTDFNSITLYFNYFDLSPEDVLEIYKVEGTSPTLMNVFNGSTPPPPYITYPATKMRIEFKSDNYLQADGFEISWATNIVSSIETTENKEVKLYPNPASTQAMVALSENPTNARISILDITGKQIFSDIIPAGELNYQLNTHHLSSGIYIIKIEDNKSIITKKLTITNG